MLHHLLGLHVQRKMSTVPWKQTGLFSNAGISDALDLTRKQNAKARIPFMPINAFAMQFEEGCVKHSQLSC